MLFPVIPRFDPKVSGEQQDRIRRLAEEFLREQPQLDPQADFADVSSEWCPDAPVLHLDDFSEIPLIGEEGSGHILQQRARLRACDGDWVAQINPIEEGFAEYCEHRLGLGHVTWLYPESKDRSPEHIALECWQDRHVRRDLVQAVRHGHLRNIHPYVSTMQVWELADLLQKTTRQPLQVIGPRPALASWANNKIEFTSMVERLLGSRYVPQMESAHNFAMLSKHVARLSQTHEHLGIKFPYGTGGLGNFLIDADTVRDMSLAEVRDYLKNLIDGHRWPACGRVLLEVWESRVLSSPSTQNWIPPESEGPPVVEGVFEQLVYGETCQFLGAMEARFGPSLQEELAALSYRMCLLFQRMGYIGRCSFDFILVGESLDQCRVEVIECNARWGGTSTPMTLANRLGWGNPSIHYGIERVTQRGLSLLCCSELIEGMDDMLFDIGTGEGCCVIFNPARIRDESGLEFIARADDAAEVDRLLRESIPERLASLVSARSTPAANDPSASR